jgi:hypothetical protein
MEETMTTVTVQCVLCSTQRTIRPGDVAPGDHPMCEKCFSPMVPVKAKATTEKRIVQHVEVTYTRFNPAGGATAAKVTRRWSDGVEKTEVLLGTPSQIERAVKKAKAEVYAR